MLLQNNTRGESASKLTILPANACGFSLYAQLYSRNWAAMLNHNHMLQILCQKFKMSAGVERKKRAAFVSLWRKLKWTAAQRVQLAIAEIESHCNAKTNRPRRISAAVCLLFIRHSQFDWHLPSAGHSLIKPHWWMAGRSTTLGTTVEALANGHWQILLFIHLLLL